MQNQNELQKKRGDTDSNESSKDDRSANPNTYSNPAMGGHLDQYASMMPNMNNGANQPNTTLPFMTNLQRLQYLQSFNNPNGSHENSQPTTNQDRTTTMGNPLQQQQHQTGAGIDNSFMFHQIQPQFRFLQNSMHGLSDHSTVQHLMAAPPFNATVDLVNRQSNPSPPSIQGNLSRTIGVTAVAPSTNGVDSKHANNNFSHLSHNNSFLETLKPNKRQKLNVEQNLAGEDIKTDSNTKLNNNKNHKNKPATNGGQQHPQGRKKVERDTQWMTQYNALKEYHEGNGHANVPMHYAPNKRLGHWINNQRQLYRKYKAGLPSSMTKRRIQLLEEFNFAWVLGKDWKHKRAKTIVTQDKMTNSLSVLDLEEESKESSISSSCMTHKLANSITKSTAITTTASVSSPAALTTTSLTQENEVDCPQNFPFPNRHNFYKYENTAFASIENNLRSNQHSNEHSHEGDKKKTKQILVSNMRKEESQHKSIPYNPSKQIVHAHNDAHKSSIHLSLSHNAKVRSGDITPTPSIDRTCSSSSPTGIITIKQKAVDIEENSVVPRIVPVYNNVNHDEVCTQSPERTKDSLPSCTTKNVQTVKTSDLQWQKHLKDLIAFKDIHGHCDVPFQYSEKKSLGYWVHNQRQVFKKWLKGDTCSLTKTRIDSLEKIGFSVKSPRALKKAKIGTSPKDKESFFPEAMHINNLSDNVANQHQTLVKDGFKGSLPLEKNLSGNDSITFVPNHTTTFVGGSNVHESKPKIIYSGKVDAFDVLWHRRLAELRAFHLNHGHSDVPSNYPENKQLGTWTMNQRQQYRKLLNGEKSSLTPQRIAALEALTFRWSLGRGMRGKDGTIRVAKSKAYNKQQSTNVRIFEDSNTDVTKFNFDILTDDSIYTVLSFLPSIQSIVSYCLASKRGMKILRSFHMENLCKSLYISSFGVDGIRVAEEHNTPYFWKNAWKNVYSLRKAIKAQAILDEIMTDDRHKNETKTLGILSTVQEQEALFYNNPSYAPSTSDERSPGYFGMLKFHAPSCFGMNPKEVFAVWGDFYGLRIFNDNLDNMLQNVGHLQYQSVADNGFGQILTAVASPIDGYTDIRQPCLYLGSASGTVLAIGMNFYSNMMSLKYDVVSMSLAHTNEVMALAWLPVSDPYNQYLMSSGCDGKVYLYPDALTLEPRCALNRLNRQILCCSNRNNVPIISLASCKIQHTLDSFQSIITGDRDGNITMWKPQVVPSFYFANQTMSNVPMFVPMKVYKSSNLCRISSLNVVQEKTLISGDTSGNVCVWDILNDQNFDSRDQSEQPPYLTMKFKIPAAHGGMIQKTDVIGNNLLTTGGNDGFIRGWDLKHGDLLGSVSCHDGVMATQLSRHPNCTLKSPVVGVYSTGRNSLVSLCRDGSLNIWNYGMVADMKIDFRIRTMSWDRTTNDIEGGVIPAAAVLFNLGGKTTSSLLVPHSNPPETMFGLDALKKIMVCDGDPNPNDEQKRLRDCMRLSIIKAAYEHSSNLDWRKFPETPFIGCDGKVYKYIKKAFALFSGMRQCRMCRRTNEGAYCCRLQLKHDTCDVGDINISDNDTDNSYAGDNQNITTMTLHDEYTSINTADHPNESSVSEIRITIDTPALKENFIRIQKNTDLPHEVSNQNIYQTEEASASGASGTINMEDTTYDFWDCHKCQRKNSSKNKRCPVCSSWRGGKRNLSVSKMNKKDSQDCSFCQFSNAEGAKACVVCHESMKEKATKIQKPKDELVKKVDTDVSPTSVEVVSAHQYHLDWQCHKCGKMNVTNAKRCKCNAWRGGRRQIMSFKRPKNEEYNR